MTTWRMVAKAEAWVLEVKAPVRVKFASGLVVVALAVTEVLPMGREKEFTAARYLDSKTSRKEVNHPWLTACFAQKTETDTETWNSAAPVNKNGSKDTEMVVLIKMPRTALVIKGNRSELEMETRDKMAMISTGKES